jgi:hypothetical protein
MWSSLYIGCISKKRERYMKTVARRNARRKIKMFFVEMITRGEYNE